MFTYSPSGGGWRPRGFFEDKAIREYWEVYCRRKGRPRGPLHQAALLCDKLGFRIKEGCYLEEAGVWVALREVTGWRKKVTQAAQDVLWRWLGRTRYHFEGLQLGRELVGDAWGDKLRFLAKRQWGIVQADGVFTPWRAHQRDQARADCQTCGGEVADWTHLLWDCGEVNNNPGKRRSN